jgi:hypothetical protein
LIETEDYDLHAALGFIDGFDDRRHSIPRLN